MLQILWVHQYRRHQRLVKLLTLASTKNTIDTKVDIGCVRVGRSVVDWLQGPVAQPDVCAHLRHYKPGKREEHNGRIQSRRWLQVVLYHRQFNLHRQKSNPCYMPHLRLLVMAALCSICGHYIFALWFLSIFYLLSSFFYSSPNLSGRRLDVYHTSTHGVDLVRI